MRDHTGNFQFITQANGFAGQYSPDDVEISDLHVR